MEILHTPKNSQVQKLCESEHPQNSHIYHVTINYHTGGVSLAQ